MGYYGWRRDDLDHRDFLFSAKPEIIANLPSAIDLRGPFMPNIYDQLKISSCVGNSSTAAIEYVRAEQGLGFIGGSRLFAYYNARLKGGMEGTDSGAQIRDGIAALNQYGLCTENDWPYIPSNVTTRPSTISYTDALNDRAIQYQSVQQTQTQIMGTLAQGLPIVFGFMLFQQFENIGSNGIVTLPRQNEQPLGGHANMLCGYKYNSNNEVLVLSRNSWGTSWGESGYCWFPMSYLTNAQLAADFWVIQLVSSPTPVPPVPDTFNVGPGVRAAMIAEGDSPDSDEIYFKNPEGKNEWSQTEGRNGATYKYKFASNTVAVQRASKVY